MSDVNYLEIQAENELLRRIYGFLSNIGLVVKPARLSEATFLPGIQIEQGVIYVDESKLLYPGDLLHEAGHLAVILPEQRVAAEVDVGNKVAEEMMAIAWSYAAAIYLDIDPRIVFHQNGYRGWSEAIIDNFSQGRYLAVPMLQWIGLTVDDAQAQLRDIKPYPDMIKWLRD